MVAVRGEEQLQRLGFDDLTVGGIVDDDMGEIGLAGDRTERGEFRRREADEIERPRPRIVDIIELRLFGRGGQRAASAEMGQIHGLCLAPSPSPVIGERRRLGY
jgi:hypothetical protein